MLPQPGKIRKKYRIGSDEKIILYLGRLHKRKGLEFLITSFSNLLDQHRDARLVIAGPDDGFLTTMKKKIKDFNIESNVVITGPLNNEEKLEAFVDADVVVYPGILEIFGLVPFEAIMCGTPVIVTDDCGCGEIIKESDGGYLVKFGDITGLSTIIGEVLTTPHPAHEKVKCGQMYIKENLSWNMLINRFLTLYHSCSVMKSNS
jgi:glycosyltransferase involved in cell wall biosynthesis